MRSSARLVAGVLALIGLAGAGSRSRPSAPSVPPAEAPREVRFTILQINDLYKIEGLLGGTVGGLARVRTLRKSLEAEGRPVLVDDHVRCRNALTDIEEVLPVRANLRRAFPQALAERQGFRVLRKARRRRNRQGLRIVGDHGLQVRVMTPRRQSRSQAFEAAGPRF